MNIDVLVVNPFQVNAYIISDAARNAVLIDMAGYDTTELHQIAAFIEGKQLNPIALISTHGHLDHVCGNIFFKEHYHVPLYMHADDRFLIDTAIAHASAFGLSVEKPPYADILLDDMEIVKFNEDLQFTVLHVPGHSPGSIALYSESDAFVITGDALFAGSIGRTDLPRGNYDVLISSIQNKLMSLPDNTRVLPGHMHASSIGDEKRTNPYL